MLNYRTLFCSVLKRSNTESPTVSKSTSSTFNCTPLGAIISKSLCQPLMERSRPFKFVRRAHTWEALGISKGDLGDPNHVD